MNKPTLAFNTGRLPKMAAARRKLTERRAPWVGSSELP
jgi:hypothetical protein